MPKPIDLNIIWMRAIACMAVVFVHVYSAGSSGAVYVATALNQLLRFGAPLLLFISSYLLHAGPPPSSLRAFVQKRVSFIVLPFLAVSTLPVTRFLLEHHPWKAVSQLVTGAGSHLFFIPVLLQFYALYVLGVRFWPRVDWVRLVLPTLAVSLSWSGLMFWADLPVNRWQWLCPSWLVFYVLGAAVAADRTWLERIWKRHGRLLGGALMGLAGLAAVQLFTIQHLTSVRMEILSTSRGPTIILYSVLFISLWASRWGKAPRPYVLGWLSSRSFGIYLVHPYVAQVASHSLPAFGTLPPLARFLAVLLASLGAVMAVERLPFGVHVVGKPGPTGF